MRTDWLMDGGMGIWIIVVIGIVMLVVWAVRKTSGNGYKKVEETALDILKKPIIELHISNIYRREEFRQKSLISDIVTGGIFGLGADGYILAIIAMQNLLKK